MPFSDDEESLAEEEIIYSSDEEFEPDILAAEVVGRQFARETTVNREALHEELNISFENSRESRAETYLGSRGELGAIHPLEASLDQSPKAWQYQNLEAFLFDLLSQTTLVRGLPEEQQYVITEKMVQEALQWEAEHEANRVEAFASYERHGHSQSWKDFVQQGREEPAGRGIER